MNILLIKIALQYDQVIDEGNLVIKCIFIIYYFSKATTEYVPIFIF